MHLLFILDYFPPYIWWIETLFNDVTDFCIKKWYTVTVITSHHDSKLSIIEKRKWVIIYRIGSNRFTIIRQALRFGLTHRTLFQSIDHIHTSTFTSAIPARILSKFYKKSCTITIHEIYDTLRYHLKGNKAKIYITFERFLLWLKRDHIVAVSHYTKKMIQDIYNIPDANISTIYNQIDSYFWDRKRINTTYIKTLQEQYHLIDGKAALFMGRLGYEKGLPYLIESLIEVIKIEKDFKLIIIAPKIYSRYSKSIQHQITTIQKQIKDNYLINNIIRIDTVKNDEELRDLMGAVDIGIIPSMSEWFCYTAAQMQAMGLSLVASKVWALPEVLDAQHTFVSYGKVQELTDALISLIKEKSHKVSPKLYHHINYQAYCDLFESFERA